MSIAVAEAEKGLRRKDGGPFGAVIIRAGEIVARAHNEVIKNSDPTCHAEMQAIRAAAKELKRFDLSDCEIYSSCEPCPMCLAAICWARIPHIYFGATRRDAAAIGFADAEIYDFISDKIQKNSPVKKQLGRKACLVPFQKWLNLKSKTQY
jgi:guanine deaminase